MTARLDLIAPVVAVTLLEDRAIVQRRAQLELPPGPCQLTVAKVSVVAVDKTVNARFEGQTSARVRDVRVVRRRVTEDRERTDRLLTARDALLRAEAEHRDLATTLHQAHLSQAALERVARTTLDDLSLDVAHGAAPATPSEAWTTTLDALDHAIAEVAHRVVELEHASRCKSAEVDDLRKRVELESDVGSEAIAELEIDVLGDPHATEATIVIEYIVPGAVWRPWHEARLDPSDTAITMRTDGCVWQSTGEDWVDVMLQFSTERPSLGISPPRLCDDPVAAQRRAPTLDVQIREQDIETTTVSALDDAGSTTKQADALPGIDDGGAPQRLSSTTRATVLANGRPHRVPIFTWTAPCRASLVCVPELAAEVLLRSEQRNEGPHPLLAGPVDLIRRGGLVGRTHLLYVAPHELFELGWGPRPELRIHRAFERLPDESRALSGRIRRPRRVTITLSNLDARPCTVRVQERLPISELEKIKIEVIESSHREVPNAHGILQWERELRGWGHDTLVVTWAYDAPSDVSGLD